MHHYRTVRLDHQQPQCLGQKGGKAAGVEHLATGDDQAMPATLRAATDGSLLPRPTSETRWGSSPTGAGHVLLEDSGQLLAPSFPEQESAHAEGRQRGRDQGRARAQPAVLALHLGPQQLVNQLTCPLRRGRDLGHEDRR